MTQILTLPCIEKPQIDTEVLVALYEKLGWTACDATIADLVQSLREALEIVRWTIHLANLSPDQECNVIEGQILSILSISDVLGLTGLTGVGLEVLGFWEKPRPAPCPTRAAMASRLHRVGQAHIQALEILVDLPSYGPCADEQER